ncbi:unnamed protein product [Linum tenue]|uniref:RNase H type-1 domain-containing protein n=1 Tax=Linum tenue TaxID=586396 RepID=A0AAV0IA03_9ROSI|nr:unnamed protein product [Linum tenue]
MGIRKLIVQTDSQTAIRLITTAGLRHPHSAMIQEARRLLAQEWEVELLHVFREGNVVADYLASLGHGLPPGDHIINTPYHMLSYWLYYDLLGVSLPRLIPDNI